MARSSNISEEAQILSVLDAIVANNDASQRELSKTTGLNVAKVNYLLKKLVEKGCLKLRNVSRNPNKLGYLYILTPKGITEKSILTMRFAKQTWNEYSKTLNKLRESLHRLSETEARRVILLGANEVTDMVIEAINSEASLQASLQVVGIVDPECKEDSRKGVPIMASGSGIDFDRAISCEHIENSEITRKYDINGERVWLV